MLGKNRRKTLRFDPCFCPRLPDINFSIKSFIVAEQRWLLCNRRILHHGSWQLLLDEHTVSLDYTFNTCRRQWWCLNRSEPYTLCRTLYLLPTCLGGRSALTMSCTPCNCFIAIYLQIECNVGLHFVVGNIYQLCIPSTCTVISIYPPGTIRTRP